MGPNFLTQPNLTHPMFKNPGPNATQPNPTHGWTRPMYISGPGAVNGGADNIGWIWERWKGVFPTSEEGSSVNYISPTFCGIRPSFTQIL